MGTPKMKKILHRPSCYSQHSDSEVNFISVFALRDFHINQKIYYYYLHKPSYFHVIIIYFQIASVKCKPCKSSADLTNSDGLIEMVHFMLNWQQENTCTERDLHIKFCTRAKAIPSSFSSKMWKSASAV